MPERRRATTLAELQAKMHRLGHELFAEGRSYYRHLASWLPHRADANVLLLAYEHMKGDHEGAVRRVAEFVGFDDYETVLEMLATGH